MRNIRRYGLIGRPEIISTQTNIKWLNIYNGDNVAVLNPEKSPKGFSSLSKAPFTFGLKIIWGRMFTPVAALLYPMTFYSEFEFSGTASKPTQG
jgi:hypothetical protein